MSLRYAILTLLATEPASGYDIVKHFRETLGYFWNAKHQQVYQELKKLSEDGLLAVENQGQEDKPDKKNYRLNPAGLAELQQWLAGSVPPNKINDALLVKLYAGQFTDVANLKAEMHSHRQTHENTLQALLATEQRYRKLTPAEQAHHQLPYLTLRRGILGEQAWLAWADEVMQVLDEQDARS
ncbi:MAG: PadR family transcriptional regulator [Oceanospirillaceae bacterium]|nr:PadR family transcriptional regulator [Oceanospirillaceae bacterium]